MVNHDVRETLIAHQYLAALKYSMVKLWLQVCEATAHLSFSSFSIAVRLASEFSVKDFNP